MQQGGSSNKIVEERSFFSGCHDTGRYKLLEVVGKGSYGVVCSAIDTQTGEKVAIKKIRNIFHNVIDATRVLREIKLLRLLRHPDIVDIKCILLPRSRRSFKDIYVVFELMDADLHQVLNANDHLTNEHHCFFLYQMLRALKYMHTANVYHRDLKPKNILVNANCKLKICDFGLARVAFDDSPSTTVWTDYVATRWYRAPELCGSFSFKYSPAIDTWSVGCIFAEIMTGKPLFPGKNMLKQLDLITDVLGTPSTDAISLMENERARNYLMALRKKQPVSLAEKFPNADPLAIRLLQKLLAFNPNDRPSAEEALADPYFHRLARNGTEPSCKPFSTSEFEFEFRLLKKESIRELIFREVLEYHNGLSKDSTGRHYSRRFRLPRISLSCICLGHRRHPSTPEKGNTRVVSRKKQREECNSVSQAATDLSLVPPQQEQFPIHHCTPCPIRVNTNVDLGCDSGSEVGVNLAMAVRCVQRTHGSVDGGRLLQQEG